MRLTLLTQMILAWTPQPRPEYFRSAFKDFLAAGDDAARTTMVILQSLRNIPYRTAMGSQSGAPYYAGKLICSQGSAGQERSNPATTTHLMFMCHYLNVGSEYERDYRAVVHWDCSKTVVGWDRQI